MRETYEHLTTSWRRVGHQRLHETESFLPSQMLPKVSVLFPLCSLIPSQSLSLHRPVGLTLHCVVPHSILTPTFYQYSSASSYTPPSSRLALDFLFVPVMTGRVQSPRGRQFHFKTLNVRIIRAEQFARNIFFFSPLQIAFYFSIPHLYAVCLIC